MKPSERRKVFCIQSLSLSTTSQPQRSHLACKTLTMQSRPSQNCAPYLVLFPITYLGLHILALGLVTFQVAFLPKSYSALSPGSSKAALQGWWIDE